MKKILIILLISICHNATKAQTNIDLQQLMIDLIKSKEAIDNNILKGLNFYLLTESNLKVINEKWDIDLNSDDVNSEIDEYYSDKKGFYIKIDESSIKKSQLYFVLDETYPKAEQMYLKFIRSLKHEVENDSKWIDCNKIGSQFDYCFYNLFENRISLTIIAKIEVSKVDEVKTFIICFGVEDVN
jgi:hypothetical protein